MHKAIKKIMQSQAGIACAVVIAFALLCTGVALALGGEDTPTHTPVGMTQPDTRPTSLTVITGNGVGSPEAAAALQSQSSQSSVLSASDTTQLMLTKQASGTSLQAGVNNNLHMPR